MDREKFVNEMVKEYDRKEISKEKIDEIIDASINACSREIKHIVIMEELSELIKEVSKAARDEQDDGEANMIQEIADVTICIAMLQRMYGITDNEIIRAIRVKLRREAERRGVEVEE